ncbi:MAG: response regulator [Pleurocapsa sp. SU_196_0]|nr:response regulator [Pleurocapsa sp. SU_196_0]
MSVAPRASILVADDDASICQLLEVILGSHYDVSVVRDGLAVLDFVKEHTPQLVILDVACRNWMVWKCAVGCVASTAS